MAAYETQKGFIEGLYSLSQKPFTQSRWAELQKLQDGPDQRTLASGKKLLRLNLAPVPESPRRATLTNGDRTASSAALSDNSLMKHFKYSGTGYRRFNLTVGSGNALSQPQLYPL